MSKPNDLNTRAAAVGASTLNEQERTIEATISTDQPVAVYDWRSRQIIDEILIARGGKFPSQVPLFDDHFASSASQLGSAREISKVENGWRAKIHFAKDAGSHRNEAWEMVRQGHVTDVSIGYRYGAKDFVDIEPGGKANVDGVEYRASANRVTRVVRKWSGVEVSTTPIGADDQAKMRAVKVNTEPPQNLDDNSQLLESGNEPKINRQGEQMTEQPKEKTEERSAPAIHVAEPKIDVEATRAEAIKAERERISAINSYRGDVSSELIDKAIEGDYTVDAARSLFFDEIIKSKKEETKVEPNHSIPTKRSGPSVQHILGAALMLRGGISIDDPALSTNAANQIFRQRGVDGGWILNASRSLASTGSLGQLEEVFDQAYRTQSMPMRDLVRSALEAEGVRCSSFDEGELMQRAMSSSAVSNMFTLAFNARILRGFVGVGDSTSAWTKSDTLPNFQAAERLQMGKYTRLERRARGKTPEHGQIDSKGESIKVYEYASKFVIDEQDLVDNTFGNIQQVTPEEMGEAAGELAPDLAYAVLMSNPTMSQDATALFHADHANLNTTAALNYTNLIAGRTDFATRVLPNGRHVSVRGDILLVPEALDATANELISVSSKIDSTYGPNDFNANRGKHTVVSDPRLDVGVTHPETGAAVTGSATTWYLASKGGKYGISLATLEGRGRTPRTRRLQAPLDGYAIGWTVDHVVGCSALGFEGLQKNTA